ncbi:MAG: KEOPS complex subunit Pcc1 [Halobacteria archaeon]|nr:KEOPS complex subunit Pcc1 [Halobacteria archaeon]
MRCELLFETTHGDPEKVACSIKPDNTDEIDTRVVDDKVVTRIERETIGSLLSTGDDYIKNLIIADELTNEE